MFNEIVAIANERVVTADDFEPFVGQTNWLSFDKAEDYGNCDAYPDADILSGVVWKFRLDGIAAFGDNRVVITLFHADGDEEKMTMAADELAIRMEDS